MESLEVEIKDWLDIKESLHKADLAKAILAMGNHGGGYIVIGFVEVEGVYVAKSTTPEISSLYNQDMINGIVARYADPVFHVELHLVTSEKGCHPVLVVPGGHRVPIRCVRSGPDGRHAKQNAYYIRRPGPASEVPQSANEWANLIRKCVVADKEHLLETLKTALEPRVAEVKEFNPHEVWIEQTTKRFTELVNEKYGDFEQSPFRRGYWFGAYSLSPEVDGVSLSKLKKELESIVGHETGWPIGIVMPNEGAEPYAYDGCIETWLGNIFSQPDFADFWRLSPSGHFISFRGYQEDNEEIRQFPGTIFDVGIPIWRVVEFLLHGYRFAKILDACDFDMHLTLCWKGLQGRSLSSLSGRNPMVINRKASQDMVVSKFTIQDIQGLKINLENLVEQITLPLYEVFDFYSISKEMITNEITRMRNG